MELGVWGWSSRGKEGRREDFKVDGREGRTGGKDGWKDGWKGRMEREEEVCEGFEWTEMCSDIQRAWRSFCKCVASMQKIPSPQLVHV